MATDPDIIIVMLRDMIKSNKFDSKMLVEFIDKYLKQREIEDEPCIHLVMVKADDTTITGKGSVYKCANCDELLALDEEE